VTFDSRFMDESLFFSADIEQDPYWDMDMFDPKLKEFAKKSLYAAREKAVRELSC